MAVQFDITFHPSWWHQNAGVSFEQAFFDDPSYRMDCDVHMRRTLYERFGGFGLGEKQPEKRPLIGTDLLAAGYVHSELMGCDIIYKPDNSPQVVCRELDSQQIASLKAPDLDKDPVWQRTQKQLDHLKATYGRVEPYINLMGVQNIALDVMGQELFMAYYEEDGHIRGLLGEITKLCMDVGKRLYAYSKDISGGVTAIVRKTVPQCYLTSNCSVEMLSNEQYEDFLLEHDTALAHTFGAFGIHHCGQTMEHVVEGYAKAPNLVFAEVGAGSDIAAVRKALPNVHLNARISPAQLLTASQGEIESAVEALYKQGQAANGGLFSISCVGIDKNVSDASINHFLAACKNLK